ncbi:MAG: acetyltransferase [Lachnospiraceae bacterium]|nr:acetyltransferase [Lachnospiraceae bacterium]
MRKRLMIIGASGHGKVVADIARKTENYCEIAFLDDDLSRSVPGYELLGRVGDYEKWREDWEFIIAIGNCGIRAKIQEKIDTMTSIATLIHPHAVIGEQVTLGKGTVVMANAVINSGAILGKGVIVNTGSTIDHDCRIGDYVHVAPGSHISGTVFVGGGAWIGVGSSIINNVKICENCIIGAGTTVIQDINESGTYVGVPAKRVSHEGKGK